MLAGNDLEEGPSIGPEASTVIFEYGVTIRRVGASWECASSSRNVSLEPREISALLRIRTIIESGAKHHANVLFGAGNAESLTRKVARIAGGLVPVQFFPYDPLRVAYTVREVCYHCERIAWNCSDVCERSVKHALYGEIQGDTVIAILEWVEPCYFEVEGLLTCLIRSYELLRYHISKALALSPAPRSYDSLITQIRSVRRMSKKQSAIIRLVLENAYEFKQIKEYRDCLQHYTPLSAPISQGILKDMGHGVRGCHLLLPDNPSCRSMTGFTFAQDIDALTYCWESATALVVFVEALAKQLWVEADS
jgi:hypothetical protein